MENLGFIQKHIINANEQQVPNSVMKEVKLQPKYDEDYLNTLIVKASENWSKIPEKDAWLKEVKGSY